MTVLLARNRQPPPTVAAGAPHAELAAELVSLPSGLLAMVCEAIVKLKVRLGAAGARASVGGRTVCGVLGVLLVESVLDAGFRRGPSRPGFEAHGPFASEFATEHTAGEGECLKVPRFHSAAEPKTARRMKPVIGPAIAAWRGLNQRAELTPYS